MIDPIEKTVAAGREVIDRFAKRQPDRPVAGVFDVSGLRVRVHTADQNYADLCQRALVNGCFIPSVARREIDIHIIEPSPTDDTALTDLPILSESSDVEEVSVSRGQLHWSYDRQNGVWQFFDPHLAVGVQVMAAFTRMAPWEASLPLRRFLMWAYPTLGLHLLHAGSLGIGDQGVLLAGSGGAGKSGTTLAGMANGLTSVGDDYVALDMAGTEARAYPVVRLMKQDKKGLDRVGLDPVRSGMEGPNWQGKYEFDFAALMPTARIDALNLRAILIPRMSGAERANLVPASAREAMLALAPSNMMDEMKSGLADCARLARRLPAYFLDLSGDAMDVAACVKECIEASVCSK